MATEHVAEQTRRPLRLWPGAVAAALVVLLRFVLPPLIPEGFLVGVIAGIAGAAIIVVWWLFFSRAPWVERLGALGVLALAVIAIRPLLDKSIATGMMNRMFYVYAAPPVLAPAFVAWAIATRRVTSAATRWTTLAATAVLACGVWTLVRTDGVMDAGAQITWRWKPTAEERLLAQPDDAPVEAAPAEPSPAAAAPGPEATKNPVPAAAPIATKAALTPPVPDATPAEWPGFRGPDRNGVTHAARIETDWTTSPPVQMWRRSIGPGWSSFAVRGDLLYTQEQRGESEVVSSYRVSTGQPVWRHRDAVRFWESNGGAGPRGTPTIVDGRVYTFGATGILNSLDAKTGAVIWSRNVAAEINKKVPMWGFASSPLVVDDVVVVAASGTMVGYDVTTGTRRWSGPAHIGSYSSPHRSTIDGVTQVLLLSASGATSVAPATGKALWEYPWNEGSVTIVQPAVIGDKDILVTTSAATGGVGVRRLAIAHRSDGWRVDERWSSNGLKPYFNDFVVHKGHAYGFDGSMLSCIDLETGARAWKGGRYGNGQLVLLPDQDLLLVISEEGDLALVSATPDRYTEVTKFHALDGKTWNHPVIVRNVLLVRNGEEMAAFRLPAASPNQ